MRRIDIADFLGLRCETVSRILTQMKQENVIATLPAGVIIIRNSEILKMYAAGIYTASTCKEISRKEG